MQNNNTHTPTFTLNIQPEFTETDTDHFSALLEEDLGNALSNLKNSAEHVYNSWPKGSVTKTKEGHKFLLLVRKHYARLHVDNDYNAAARYFTKKATDNFDGDNKNATTNKEKEKRHLYFEDGKMKYTNSPQRFVKAIDRALNEIYFNSERREDICPDMTLIYYSVKDCVKYCSNFDLRLSPEVQNTFDGTKALITVLCHYLSTRPKERNSDPYYSNGHSAAMLSSLTNAKAVETWKATFKRRKDRDNDKRSPTKKRVRIIQGGPGIICYR